MNIHRTENRSLYNLCSHRRNIWIKLLLLLPAAHKMLTAVVERLLGATWALFVPLSWMSWDVIQDELQVSWHLCVAILLVLSLALLIFAWLARRIDRCLFQPELAEPPLKDPFKKMEQDLHDSDVVIDFTKELGDLDWDELDDLEKQYVKIARDCQYHHMELV